MSKLLTKKEAIFILYDKLYQDDFYYVIKITTRYAGDFYKQWIEFKDELEELSITQYDGDWICEDIAYKDRKVLKKELESRGYNVVLGKIFED